MSVVTPGKPTGLRSIQTASQVVAVRGDVRPMLRQLVRDVFESLDEAFRSEPTIVDHGVAELAEFVDHFAIGDVVVLIGSQTSSHALQTKLSTTIASRRTNGPVLWLTNGLAGTAAVQGVLAELANVRQWRIRSGILERKDIERLATAASALIEHALEVFDEPLRSFKQARTMIEGWRGRCSGDSATVIVRSLQPSLDELWQLRSLARAARVVIVTSVRDELLDLEAADIAISLSGSRLVETSPGCFLHGPALLHVLRNSRGPTGACTIDLEREVVDAEPDTSGQDARDLELA